MREEPLHSKHKSKEDVAHFHQWHYVFADEAVDISCSEYVQMESGQMDEGVE